MPVIIPDDPSFGLLFYGDTAGTLGANQRGGNQTFADTDSSISTSRIATLIGDAHDMTGAARGGNDDLLTEHRQDATVAGDAQTSMGGHTRGGNDTLSANAEFNATVYGDAPTLSGQARGGNDHITIGTDGGLSLAFGDAAQMTSQTRGGDDQLTAVAPAEQPAGVHDLLVAQLFGDANLMGGAARGGNDTLIGADNLTNTLVGDGGTMTGSARGGNDTLIGGATTDPALPATNEMFGDARELGAGTRGGNDTLISGASADDQMWGDGVLDPGARGGKDTFVFADANGHDTIHDFQQGTDKIDLAIAGIGDFNDLQPLISQTADGSLITFDDADSILVLGVSQLTAKDFLFG